MLEDNREQVQTVSSKVAELKDLVRALLLDKKNQSSAPVSSPALVKAVEPNCVTCGGTHSYQNCPATSGNVYRDNIQDYVSHAAAVNYNQENTSFYPQMVANQIRPLGFPPHQNNQNNFNRGNNFNQNRGGNFNQSNFNHGGNFNQGQLHRPQGQNVQNQLANLTNMLSKFMSSYTASSSGSGTLLSNTIANPKEELKGTKETKDQVQTLSSPSTTPVQPSVSQSKTPNPISEPVVTPVSALMPNVKSSIPYPSRRDNERHCDQANEQIEKFYEIFRYMSFKISFMDALILMPKFAFTLKALIGNKEKLSEMTRTLMNEHCSVVILNKLPKKLGDPGKFLIPCEFPRMDECLALADLGASINLMPFSIWEALSLPELTPTCITLELADRSVSKPIGIAKDVSFKVGVFHFPPDFVVVDFEPDPRVLIILGRCFLKNGQALINVHKGELTLRIRNEAITYNLDQTVSGNPTPHDDLIISTTSPTLTLFGDIDFLLFEEADAFLGLEDDPNSPKINPFYYDLKGDILLLKTILNSEPLPPLPYHEQYLPSYKKELKVCEAKTVKSSVDEPHEVELKDLPPHLEYVFLEGNNKLPVIIAKELGDEEKSASIKVLKSHKRAIAWKLFDIQGINLKFCTHKILMEEDYKPTMQHQRRVNPKIYDVIKQEVEKLFDAGLIYPISDSPWVNSVHCVPKKGGFTVVENEENELIPTRLVTGWRVCIDYRKLNEATRKDHFPLPFMDQMLERLAGNEFYCFLDGFSGYFQIPIGPRDHEKTMFTCPYGTFAYRRMPFDLCNAPGTFQRCMLSIFHDLVEQTMEVVMDDFSIFGNFFENCLSRLDKMLQRCEDTNLSLNWEKSHFMVKEGIDAKVRLLWWVLLLQEFDFKVLDTKGAENLVADHLSRLENPYENVEAKALPTNDARVVCKFLKSLFARFGSPRAIISDRGTHFCNEQFAKVMLKYGVTHRLSTAYHPQTSGKVEEFDFKVIYTHGAENYAADHLSRLENPYENIFDPKEINETFPLESLNKVAHKDPSTPWFADLANYHAENFIIKGMTSQQKQKFFKDARHYF
nr:reverse transcriptase domain-containing protein [Tanacetum cinerariifolium]